LRNPGNIYDRLNACKKLGQVGATPAIPDLIHALDDKSSLIRKAANNSLKKITGQDFAYDSSAQRSVRLWTIERWEKWYNTVRKEEASEQLKSSF
jgi:HEAT repeat protein